MASRFFPFMILCTVLTTFKPKHGKYPFYSRGPNIRLIHWWLQSDLTASHELRLTSYLAFSPLRSTFLTWVPTILVFLLGALVIIFVSRLFVFLVITSPQVAFQRSRILYTESCSLLEIFGVSMSFNDFNKVNVLPNNYLLPLESNEKINMSRETKRHWKESLW